MRNQGGGIGISVVTTLLARRAQAHQTVLVAHMTPYDAAFQTQQHAIQTTFASQAGTVPATQKALAESYHLLVRQSTLLAYIDNFRWLAAGVLCLAGNRFLPEKRPNTAPRNDCALIHSGANERIFASDPDFGQRDRGLGLP